MDYVYHILIVISVYVTLAVSLNLIAGYAGLISIGHAAFYGIGAYVAALMALNWHTPFWMNISCAVLCCGLLGALVGIPSLRIRNDYFVIATFAFQIIVFNVLNNWVLLTGGPMGLPGIPQPAFFGLTVSSHQGFLLLSGLLCALSLWVVHRITRSPFGRVLQAIREDEVLALSIGKSVTSQKILVFVIGGAMAAIAGTMYACYITFVDPSSFTIVESIFILAIVIIGGAGSYWGPVLGAVVLVVLPEVLRFVGLPTSVAANARQIVYGGLLVAFMIWRPQGFLGEYAFQRKGR